MTSVSYCEALLSFLLDSVVVHSATGTDEGPILGQEGMKFLDNFRRSLMLYSPCITLCLFLFWNVIIIFVRYYSLYVLSYCSNVLLSYKKYFLNFLSKQGKRVKNTQLEETCLRALTALITRGQVHVALLLS